MGSEKFPSPSEIPWDKINEIRITADGENYSFEFELHGKKQRMTIGINEDGQTTFTLSGIDGKPIVFAKQKKDEIKIIDFTTKSPLPFWVKKLQKK
ncbi:MAG: hypothetical protein N3G22_00345 [Candidatus Micrarchaeota archaeon]|nr:hypothetical protein [Candidatus Micrarchaeota archaeon]